jgi:hypothetical protein
MSLHAFNFTDDKESRRPVINGRQQRRAEEQHITDSGVSRFPRRLKLQPELFDGRNLTWENAPRFDPDKVSDAKWLIDFFIAEQGINLIYGPPGSFKSTLTLLFAKEVAAGSDFFNMKTLRRRVLYLDYENPQGVIKTRNELLKLNLPHNRRLIVWDRFTGIPVPHPTNPMLKRFVKNCVREKGVGPVIVFDSWSSLLRVGEGGESTGQTAPIYKHLRRLADLGATIIVIDHSRKYRHEILYGSPDKIAKSDTIHGFEVLMNNTKNSIVRATSILKRYTPEGAAGFCFEIVNEKGEDGWHVKELRRIRDPKREEQRLKMKSLRKIIRQHPGSNQKRLTKLAVKIGFSRDQTIMLLNKGKGKYWKLKRVEHGKHCYQLLKPRVP